MTPEITSTMENMAHEYALNICKCTLWALVVQDAIERGLLTDDSAFKRIIEKLREKKSTDNYAPFFSTMQDALPEVMREMREMLAAKQ